MKRIVLVLLALITLSSCFLRSTRPEPAVDLEQIRERGRLRVITSYGPISYFIYRGQPMGYEYELIQRFGRFLALPVDLVIAEDIDHMIELLNSGEGDLIAYRLTVNSERRELVEFSRPLYFTRQVLVQRKPDDWRTLPRRELEERLVRNPVELDGVQVHVRKGAAYASRLRNLEREIGGRIAIVEAEADLPTEELIARVAEGSIDYTVADEDIARLIGGYYSNIDVNTAVGLEQQISWAVRKDTPQLLQAVNQWLAEAQGESDFFVIHRKYFQDHRAYRVRVESDLFPINGGSISPWDELFQRYADKIDWDWRMLAALAYQESRFNPRARSWMGATGLMQLMPATARHFGARNLYDPQENLRAAVAFIGWLQDYWGERISDPDQRLRFVLASYNVGQGHVEDARRLAQLHELNPDQWYGNVDHYLLAKADPHYYNQEVVQFGYARGREPVEFVEKVLELTEHYRRFAE